MKYVKRRSKIDGSGWGDVSHAWEKTKEEIDFFKKIQQPKLSVGTSFWYNGVYLTVQEVVPMTSTRCTPVQKEPKQTIFEYNFMGWCYGMDKSFPNYSFVEEINKEEVLLYKHDSTICEYSLEKILNNQSEHKKFKLPLSIHPSKEDKKIFKGLEQDDIEVFCPITIEKYEYPSEPLSSDITIDKYLSEQRKRFR